MSVVLHIKYPGGIETIDTENSTVNELKVKVSHLRGFHPDAFILVHCDEELEGDRLLDEYFVGDEQVQVVLSPKEQAAIDLDTLGYGNKEAIHLLRDLESSAPLLQEHVRKQDEKYRQLVEYMVKCNRYTNDCLQGLLAVSALHGLYDCAAFLLGLQRDIVNTMHNGATPLCNAAYEGHSGVVKLLLENGAKSDLRSTEDGETALHHAAREGHTCIVDMLLLNNSNPDITNEADESALHLAAQRGHTKVVRLLLKHNANPNLEDRTRCTALHAASSQGYLSVMHMLLNKKADPNAISDTGTPLQGAVNNCKEAAVCLLLEQGADPDLGTWSSDENPALVCAAEKGFVSILQILLENRADTNVKCARSNNTALHLAKNDAVTRLLLEYKANSTIVNRRGVTALAQAAGRGDRASVKLILDSGTTPAAREMAKDEALLGGYPCIVQLLERKER